MALVVAGSAWWANRAPTLECGPPAVPVPNRYRIAPARVVVRPWLGPHHVYAIFVVPDRFNSRKYSATLTVETFEKLVRRRLPEKSYVDDTLAQPGHYLRRVFVPTRVALWFFLTGRFGNLRTPCHWELVFADSST